MKKFLSGIALVGMVCLASTGVFAQDKANGEKVYKAKCASCHKPDGKMVRVKPPLEK
jgi:cytochrome c